MISPEDYKTIPCPTYPSIRMAYNCKSKIASELDGANCRDFALQFSCEKCDKQFNNNLVPVNGSFYLKNV